jgi:hypothetical protein
MMCAKETTMARKKPAAKAEKKPRKPSVTKKRRRPARKSKPGEAAQIHQNIHPVEPTPELEPR